MCSYYLYIYYITMHLEFKNEIITKRCNEKGVKLHLKNVRGLMCYDT